jgi:hypothetical protein
VEANSTGGQGSRRAVAPSDDDDDISATGFKHGKAWLTLRNELQRSQTWSWVTKHKCTVCYNTQNRLAWWFRQSNSVFSSFHASFWPGTPTIRDFIGFPHFSSDDRLLSCLQRSFLVSCCNCIYNNLYERPDCVYSANVGNRFFYLRSLIVHLLGRILLSAELCRKTRFINCIFFSFMHVIVRPAISDVLQHGYVLPNAIFPSDVLNVE